MADRALHLLETERLRIALVPAPKPNFGSHKIRVIESENPEWYRRFSKPYWRGPRSFQLRRSRVEKALKRVCKVRIVRRNGYEVRILGFLEGWNGDRENQAGGF